jgi:cytochrome c oxidase subunit 4
MTDRTESARHSHPNYVAIWGVLVAALVVSILMGEMQLPVVTAVLIFSVAIAKAFLVAAYYMHLRFEPAFVVAIVVTGLACLYVLFVGLVPDLVFPPLEQPAR